MKEMVGFFLVVFTLSLQVRAAFEPKTTHARAVGLGNTFVAYPGDVGGIFINPAGLANLRQISASVFYTRLFGLPEFTLWSDVFTLPAFRGILGGGIVSYGFDLYRENIFCLTFARTYYEKIRVGINAKILSLEIRNYGSDRRFALDVGFQTTIGENLFWGFSAINLNVPSFGEKTPDRVAQVFSTGFLYQSSSDLRILADMVKDVRFPVNSKLGLEYQPLTLLILRAGWNSNPSLFSVGIGFQFSRFRIDYGFSSHPDLGETQGVSLLYLFSSGGPRGKKEN